MRGYVSAEKVTYLGTCPVNKSRQQNSTFLEVFENYKAIA